MPNPGQFPRNRYQPPETPPPTPAEMEERMAAIRATWSQEDRQRHYDAARHLPPRFTRRAKRTP